MSTNEMYINIPPAKANIQSDAEDMFPIITPITMPNTANTEDTMLYMRAWRTDIPAFNSTAKSPTESMNITIEDILYLYIKVA